MRTTVFWKYNLNSKLCWSQRFKQFSQIFQQISSTPYENFIKRRLLVLIFSKISLVSLSFHWHVYLPPITSKASSSDSLPTLADPPPPWPISACSRPSGLLSGLNPLVGDKKERELVWLEVKVQPSASLKAGQAHQTIVWNITGMFTNYYRNWNNSKHQVWNFLHI